MKSRLLDAIRNLVPILFYAIPVSAGVDNSVDPLVPEGQGGTPAQLSEFFSLESVLIVVFVLLVLAVIAHRTKSP